MPQVQIEGVDLELVRKNIRTIRLTVYAPDGRVRAAVPLRMPLESIQQFVVARRAWIRKHQATFAARQPAPQLRYEDNETHYYQGRGYALRLLPAVGRPQVILREEQGQLELHLPPGNTAETRAALLAAWYRARLKEQVPVLLQQWQPVVGAQAAEWGVKQMKTRWGTCNTRARRIWLNLELIKRPPQCLAYVVVHELVHLHERLHNARFWGFMDQFMPDWRQHKAELNQVALTPAMHPDAD
ncbi:SprT family zinc-dependent metalloprotease [Hymenobacter koreensis]|uniref:SprT family zinc-dependent metalloprotease n=1 Tax=Hymenobacter koreensis TaxID=1084523 RepID=A0ABP8J4P4_9BACT